MKTLKDLPLQTSAQVTSLLGDPILQERLRDMGIRPGIAVRSLQKIPFGGMLVEAAQGFFALRSDELDCIEVQSA